LLYPPATVLFDASQAFLHLFSETLFFDVFSQVLKRPPIFKERVFDDVADLSRRKVKSAQDVSRRAPHNFFRFEEGAANKGQSSPSHPVQPGAAVRGT
jgi:hypothetical protein